MDETTFTEPHYRTEGFERQRLCVVPRPQVETALRSAMTRRLTVTDAGYYPRARGHRMTRTRRGADETIVIVCVDGAGQVRIGDDVHALTAADCIIIPAGKQHEYRADESDPWTIWWMHVRGPDAEELTASGILAAPVVRLHTLDRTVALLDELVTLMERRSTSTAMIAASGIAMHVLTRIAADSTLPVEGSPVERAMRHLEARIDSVVQVGELAALVGMSPSHLTALFRRATGGGPAAYHTSLKMTRARTLLDTTSLPITEVANAVGYADPLYFSRHFRRVHGVSPSAYRAQDKA